MMVRGVVEVNDASFEEAVRGNSVVVVDFWAPWCAPCRVVSPVIEALALDYDGRAFFAKINVDENQASVMRYQIMGIPTLLFFRKGRLADRIIGATSRAKIEATLKKQLD